MSLLDQVETKSKSFDGRVPPVHNKRYQTGTSNVTSFLVPGTWHKYWDMRYRHLRVNLFLRQWLCPFARPMGLGFRFTQLISTIVTFAIVRSANHPCGIYENR